MTDLTGRQFGEIEDRLGTSITDALGSECDESDLNAIAEGAMWAATERQGRAVDDEISEEQLAEFGREIAKECAKADILGLMQDAVRDRLTLSKYSGRLMVRLWHAAVDELIAREWSVARAVAVPMTVSPRRTGAQAAGCSLRRA